MLLSKTLMPQGQSLSSLLSKPTNEQLRSYLKRQNLSFEVFDHLKPWAAVMTLTQARLLEMGMSENGVDSYFASKARKEGKITRFLETPEEQIEIISKIGEGEEDATISQTLQELEAMPSEVEDMMKAWKNGDVSKLEQELLTPLKKRNDAWMEVLSKMLSRKQSAFVLVGTLHLVGNDGLLKRFERLGYRIEALE